VDHRRALQTHAPGHHAVEDDEAGRAGRSQKDVLQRVAGLAEQAGGGDQKGERDGGGQGQQQVGFDTLQDFTFT
jgi:hypothetical protein